MRRSAVRSGTKRKYGLKNFTTAAITLALFTGCDLNLKSAYAIRATVSGLVGKGLVLEVNGHEGATVNFDGEVILSYMVSGYHYSVTVKAQPSNPVQTCEVANASGVMGSADVTNVMVTCATTFAVGGTVSGLNGSGLVLHSSLGDDLSITGNGSFVFPTRAAASAEYLVTVKSQPAAPIQTCSVGNATGTVGNTDMLNVTVICSTNAFQVGGTVNGLAIGTKVVLQNNGTNDLEVTGGGRSPVSFTFSQGVADSATYEVKVKTQPTNPWQTCTVTSGTGTIASAAVGSVNVNCTINQYAIVVNVSGLKGTGLVLQNNSGDDLAVTANGNFAFATHLESGASYSVKVKTQPVNPAQPCVVTNESGTVKGTDVTNLSVTCHSWGTAELVETDNTGDAISPQVAIDISGNAVAVWYQLIGTHTNVWANYYVSGSGWGTAQPIETDDAGNAGLQQVAMDASGNAIAVWNQGDSTRNNIWANRYVAGNGWGKAQLIETDDSGSAQFPQVAMDVSGNAIAVWYQSDGTRTNIWAKRYVASSGWGTSQFIETDNAGNAFDQQVAMNSAGDAIAVWRQSDGTRYNIWANYYVVGGGWGKAQLIETDNAGDASSPQVAMDSSGNAIAVWYQSDGTHNHIWANRYVAGSGWGSARLIETNNTKDADFPQIALDAFGNAMAVWEQKGSTYWNIWANRYTVGSGWGTAQLIETDDTGSSSSPQVAIDSAGNATAVWQQSDWMRYSIWTNRYAADSGWGTPQLLETDDVNAASVPQVAMNASGSAIAVWNQGDGTRNNIWANRY